MYSFGLSQKTINSINDIFKKHAEIKQVIIYGSRAKGNYTNGSDIDLTLKGEDISFSLLLEIENEIEDLVLPYKVDLSIYDKIDSVEVKEHISRVGKFFFKIP